MKPKNELTRVIKSEDALVADGTGKARGRGAYVCKSEACVKRARKIRGLERALSAQGGSLYDTLETEGSTDA
ncbi:MAG: YlxR family protein [Oscillospiraceae bacterium]|nr:YlxR family protein [Oscillospiraceae bacterium]